MLKADHANVNGLYEKFERTKGQLQTDIAATAIMELEVHAAWRKSSSIQPFKRNSTKTA